MGGGGSQEFGGLVFTAIEDTVFTFLIRSNLTVAQFEYLEYSLDNGATWTRITNVASTEVTGSTPTVLAGESVLVRGNGSRLGVFNQTGVITSTGLFNASGNIMSLLALDGYATATTAGDYAFEGLFGGNTKLYEAKDLILPATTLKTRSYTQMFSGCSSLISAPRMDFTTLTGTYCCSNMFRSCTNLASVQDTLYPTTLVASCYTAMFNGCKALVNAPVLPALHLAGQCYQQMFGSCTSLKYIKCMTLDALGSNSSWWVDSVPSGGTFVKNSAATWENTFDRNTIPTGWTVQTASE